MKNLLKFAALALLMSAINHPLDTCLAQGSLTPPGAPAPTMKSLAQIEPRTPISSLPYTITSPGSYYVTTNLTGVSGQNGISINTGNVTVDLDGFTLQGVPGSTAGIALGGTYDNVVIRNGALINWGNSGVDAYSVGYSRNLVFENLTVSGNGYNGIYTEAGSSVHDCLAIGNTNDGISSVGGEISHCVSRNNGSHGFSASVMESGSGCTLRQCVAEYNAGGGFTLTNSQAIECDSQFNTGWGYSLGSSAALNCSSKANTSYGMVCYGTADQILACRIVGNQNAAIIDFGPNGGNVIKNCIIATNGGGILMQGTGGSVVADNDISNCGTGIDILDSNNRIDSNHILVSNPSVSQYGIVLNYGSSNNVVVRNSIAGALSPGYDYSNSGANDIGPIGTAATATSPWANIAH